MNNSRDLQLVLDSGTPLVAIETTDEERVLHLLKTLTLGQRAKAYRPLFRWTITDGLQRVDLDLEPQRHNAAAEDVLRHIRAVDKPGIFALLDFHPFLAEPVNVRLLKDIALAARSSQLVVLLIGHRIEIPQELAPFAARFALRVPDAVERRAIVERCLTEYREETGQRTATDATALELLVKNLAGLAHADTERLARNAIRDDGAITATDVPAVMKAKHELLGRSGALAFEYETVPLADVAGFRRLKGWLAERHTAFSADRPPALDPPKGILLIGVQGCGKSLAAKAAASAFGLPLLRLDFGSLYNKYHGETERNLREALLCAQTLSPCVLWLDEIEKSVAGGHDDSGTARRVLGTLLTWLAERNSPVFLVATANQVDELPAELVRKGRFDEVFFVDLPGPTNRAEILAIHLRRRGIRPERLNLAELVAATDGFSGAELEQGVVAALYSAHAVRADAAQEHFATAFRQTRPLSVLMAERVAALRAWAAGRTVPAD